MNARTHNIAAAASFISANADIFADISLRTADHDGKPFAEYVDVVGFGPQHIALMIENATIDPVVGELRRLLDLAGSKRRAFGTIGRDFWAAVEVGCTLAIAKRNRFIGWEIAEYLES